MTTPPEARVPTAGTRLPVVDFLVLDPEPWLRGLACDECRAIYLERRNACARCGGRGFTPRRLAGRGRLRTFTTVLRAPAGVPTPYVAVVVDLDGGGVVRANLLDPPPSAQLKAGLPVELTTWVAANDPTGAEAVAFGFRLLERDSVDEY